MSKMYREDISKDAIEALSDLLMLEDWSREQKISLEEAVFTFISNFNEEETIFYKKALKELDDKKYITVVWSDNYKEGDEIHISKLHVTLMGKRYIFKYLERTGRYSMRINEHEKTIDDAINKIINGGVYILIMAIIATLNDIINTIVNVYTAFH